jgi:hypothetical protein
MQTDGLETEGLMVSRENVISVDAAYRAAVEFLQEPVLPASISWLDLEEMYKAMLSDRG